MAEYSEYQRRRTKTVRDKKQKHSYGKKFIRQLIIAIVIFAVICAPVLPASLKESAKAAINYTINKNKFTSALSRIFETAATGVFNENEEDTNEDTTNPEKNL
ncbi:MAG: hypothetical protein IKW64_02950 [Clostridia bacterium]|nr:hypothetical protein [Clostridia bacterium]